MQAANETQGDKLRSARARNIQTCCYSITLYPSRQLEGQAWVLETSTTRTIQNTKKKRDGLIRISISNLSIRNDDNAHVNGHKGSELNGTKPAQSKWSTTCENKRSITDTGKCCCTRAEISNQQLAIHALKLALLDYTSTAPIGQELEKHKHTKAPQADVHGRKPLFPASRPPHEHATETNKKHVKTQTCVHTRADV